MNPIYHTMPNQKPKIAVIDLTLHYPPKGGACVDIFNTFSRLQDGYDIKLYGVSWPSEFPRGQIANTCPLPYELVHCQETERTKIVASVSASIDKWQPDLVFIADGWTLKPYISQAIRKNYKTILRLYSYEMLCPRTNERWYYSPENPSIQCNNWALTDCPQCLDCAKEYKATIEKAKNGAINPVIEEALIANIWNGDYLEALKSTFSAQAIIVYNSYLKNFLKQHTSSSIYIVPGGVDLATFNHTENHQPTKPFTIVVFGRMDAASKGAKVCIKAGKKLAKEGIDFKMIITKSQESNFPWLEEIGWCSQAEIRTLLQDADCAIMPSLWEEAFGMTWLEAMAMKVPVIASKVAGPSDHIVHDVNGLFFNTGNPNSLSEQILRLYANPDLSKTLVKNAYNMVKSKLTWSHAAQQTQQVIEHVLQH